MLSNVGFVTKHRTICHLIALFQYQDKLNTRKVEKITFV